MIGRNLHEWERETLRDLLRLVEERAAAEQACREKYENAKLEANREIARARKTIAADRERERQAISTACEEACRAIHDKHAREQAAADKLRDFSVQEAKQRGKTDEEKTKTAFADALWTADSLHEAAEKQAKEQLDTLKRKAAAGAEAIDSIWQQAEPFFQKGGVNRGELEPEDLPPSADLHEPLARMEAAIARGNDALAVLQNKRSLQWVGAKGLIIWVALFGMIAAVPALVMPEYRLWCIIGGGAFLLLASALTHMKVRSAARRRCRETATTLASALALAVRSRQELLRSAAEAHKAAHEEAARVRNGQKVKAQEKFTPPLTKIADRTRADIATAEDKHERDVERLRNWQYESLQKAEKHFGPLLQQSLARYDAQLAEAEKQFEQRKDFIKEERNRQWNELSGRSRAKDRTG